MPFTSQRAALTLDADTEGRLTELARSRTEPRQRVERAQMLLMYALTSSWPTKLPACIKNCCKARDSSRAV